MREELITQAELGDPEAQYKLGEYYEGEKNIPEACKLFEQAAEQYHANSQFKLGFYYRWGEIGFPADIEKGRFWLKQAAEKEHKQAQFHLGNLFNKEQNFEEAAYWLEKSAKQDEKRAMFRFALLNEGKGFSGADINTAVYYYTKLAKEYSGDIDEDNTDAMLNLGIMYCNGQSIKRDAIKGKSLIEDGLVFCKDYKIKIKPYECCRLGILYCTGEINPNKEPKLEDLDKGIKFLNIAIDDGLAGFHPQNIENSKKIRDMAIKQKEKLIGVKDNQNKIQKNVPVFDVEQNSDFQKAIILIIAFEKVFFTDTAFSEKTIMNDLQIRRSRDIYSSMGSGGRTNELFNKKQVYYNWFDEHSGNLYSSYKPLMQLNKDHPNNKIICDLISRYEKCLQQIEKLRNIVVSFS